MATSAAAGLDRQLAHAGPSKRPVNLRGSLPGELLLEDCWLTTTNPCPLRVCTTQHGACGDRGSSPDIRIRKSSVPAGGTAFGTQYTRCCRLLRSASESAPVTRPAPPSTLSDPDARPFVARFNPRTTEIAVALHQPNPALDRSSNNPRSRRGLTTYAISLSASVLWRGHLNRVPLCENPVEARWFFAKNTSRQALLLVRHGSRKYRLDLDLGYRLCRPVLNDMRRWHAAFEHRVHDELPPLAGRSIQTAQARKSSPLRSAVSMAIPRADAPYAGPCNAKVTGAENATALLYRARSHDLTEMNSKSSKPAAD